MVFSMQIDKKNGQCNGKLSNTKNKWAAEPQNDLEMA